MLSFFKFVRFLRTKTIKIKALKEVFKLEVNTIKLKPENIFEEYKTGSNYKANIGKRGITEQGKVNERFFVGDHWHGAKCGNSRPLVRRNIIKRIAEFKMSSITAAPLAVNYTADGISDIGVEAEQDEIIGGFKKGEIPQGDASNAEISAVMQTLSEYFKITAERLRLDLLKEQALRNCYISGTGLLYTYWDETIKTGLYADESKTTAINGDIRCEVLEVEKVVFGEPNTEEIENQPYILISRRRNIEECKRMAKRNKCSDEEIEKIIPDNVNTYSEEGQYGENEPIDNQRVTTIIKFYKEWNEDGTEFRIMCTECTEKVVLRKPFDIKIKHYPIAIMPWERRRSCIYGESEITYLIPNQIAINRCLTAAVWSLISTGMPIMIVNGDVVTQHITNEPGQVLKVYGDANEITGAIKYVQPPIVQSQYINATNEMAMNTLSDSGANDAALGNIKPDNATAIIQMREAALQPMQMYMNRFYDFIEQLARIWADFWINLYGKRNIKTVTEEGTEYIAFDGNRYKNLVITARIDVGASTLWSEAVVISTLDNLLERNIIDFAQYLDRLPNGLIPDVTGLKKDLQVQAKKAELQAGMSDEAILQDFAQQQPELFKQYQRMPATKQMAMLAKIKGRYNDGVTTKGSGVQ